MIMQKPIATAALAALSSGAALGFLNQALAGDPISPRGASGPVAEGGGDAGDRATPAQPVLRPVVQPVVQPVPQAVSIAAPAAEHEASNGPGSSAPLGPQDKLVWHRDLEEAKRIAKKEGKHLLLDFTGSEWCGFCSKLHAEVFDQPDYASGAEGDFVHVVLDFRSDLRARRDLPFAEQNDRLRASLNVEAFPTVLLMTSDGVPYESFPYRAGGAGPYVDRLLFAREKALFLEKNVPKIAGAVAGAQSQKQAQAAADEAILLLTQAGAHPLARSLVPIVSAVMKAEAVSPKREAAAVAALSAAEVVTKEIIDRAFRLDPRNGSGLPETALAGAFRSIKDVEEVRELVDRAEALRRAGPIFDVQRAAQLYGDCAYWSQNWLGDASRAAIHARFALSLEPKDPDLRAMLEGLSAGK